MGTEGAVQTMSKAEGRMSDHVWLMKDLVLKHMPEGKWSSANLSGSPRPIQPRQYGCKKQGLPAENTICTYLPMAGAARGKRGSGKGGREGGVGLWGGEKEGRRRMQCG